METQPSDGENGAVVPVLGLQFNSFIEVESFMKNYGDSINEAFTTQRSRLLPSCDPKKHYNAELRYLYIYFACKFGGTRYREESTKNRKTSTYKIDCPALVVFRVSKDKQFLEIRKINLLHEGHPDSKAFYQYIPEVRRLTPGQRQIARDVLELRGNKKLLQLKIIDEHNKFVTLKDLSNIQASLRREDDLVEAINLLKQKGATPKIFVEDDKLKAIYFSTSDMRQSMNAWPEILFIDGTYKLLKTNMTVMTLLVEDSNASTEIVGIALLVREDYRTFTWFLETFKSENTSACSRINCIMGDKDLLERDVLKEVFSNVPIYICLFHTFRTFSREINTDKMNISKSERVECLKFLEKLAYSSSAQEYDETYIKFCQRAPKRVLDYFDKNWHVIRNEWTVYSMSSGNLHNRTNNRTESANARIKNFVPKRSTLMDFIHDIFSYFQSHKHQVNLKTSKSFTRRRITDYSSDSCELEYMDYLTREASMYVLTEIENYPKVVITSYDGKECLIKSKNITIHVTESSCECITWTSSLLPCRHIFAVRKYFGAPLFSRSLCSTRWTKEYCKKTQRSFRPTTENHNPNHTDELPSITQISSKEMRTMKEKKKDLDSSLKDVMNVAILSCGPRFHRKVNFLKDINLFWNRGSRISICETNDSSSYANRDDECENKILNTNANGTQPSLGVSRKRQILSPLIHDLIRIASSFTEIELRRATETIKKIESFWRQQVEVSVQEITSAQDGALSPDGMDAPSDECSAYSGAHDPQEVHQTIEERLRILRLDSNQNSFSLSQIKVPTDIVVRGRPRQSLDTYIRFGKGKMQNKIQHTSVSSRDPIKNVCKDLNNDNLSKIKMPSSVRSKGRPPGSQVTAIGLPRHTGPTKFSQMTDLLKIKEMTKWLKIPKEIVEDVLNRKRQVTQNDFNLSPYDLKDAFVDDDVNIVLLETFFETETFAIFKEAIEAKKKINIQSCDICARELTGRKVRCDSCLSWFHFKCGSCKSVSARNGWICKICSKK